MDVERAWVVMRSVDADPVQRVRASQVVMSHAQGWQCEAMVEVSLAEPPVWAQGRPCDPAPAEIGCALAITTGQADRQLTLAFELTEEVPGVHAALKAGFIDYGKACEIAARTRELDVEVRRELCARAVAYAGSHTRGQVRGWLDRKLVDLDPDAAERRRKKACTRRRVWHQPEADGMATIGAFLSAEEAAAVMAALTAKAGNIDGPIDGNRADMLVALCTGTELGAPIPVQVIETPAGPVLAGHGPISAEHAGSVCERATRITLVRPGVQIGYRPGVDLRRWVRARDRHCRFPGCRRPAVGCDLDHVVAWPFGATESWNLQCLCRLHHRLKTHTDWQVIHLGQGVLQWISPTGRIYYTSLEDP